MAPVARRLSDQLGVLEPIQTGLSVQDQVDELRGVLLRETATPAVLVGYSWGAWLSLLLASMYPELVGKVIMVSSGAFSETYVKGLSERRLSRLLDVERVEFQATVAGLNDPGAKDKDALLSRLGRLASRADAYAPI